MQRQEGTRQLWWQELRSLLQLAGPAVVLSSSTMVMTVTDQVRMMLARTVPTCAATASL